MFVLKSVFNMNVLLRYLLAYQLNVRNSTCITVDILQSIDQIMFHIHITYPFITAVNSLSKAFIKCISFKR